MKTKNAQEKGKQRERDEGKEMRAKMEENRNPHGQMKRSQRIGDIITGISSIKVRY